MISKAHVDGTPFATRLPHGLLIDPAGGVVLLSTPRWGKPTLALGCAWRVEPRNIEVVDEAVCLDMARTHEMLLRGLPVGAALQVCMTIRPTDAVSGWTQLREAHAATPLLQAQQAAIRRGLPHQQGPLPLRLREVTTLVTLRLPMSPVDPTLTTLLGVVSQLPHRSGRHLARRLETHFHDTLSRLETLRTGSEGTLRSAGHTVTRLDGQGVGQALARALDPLATDEPVILPELPLAEQALRGEAMTAEGGWSIGGQTAQVLSLHRAPPQTYPGILSAPRAPNGTQPLALWEAWPGALSVVVNVAVVDQTAEKAHLRTKRWLARLHGGGSIENTAVFQEIDQLLSQFFLTGGHMLWARVHVVLWGQFPHLTQGIDRVIRAGRQLNLEFLPEPVLGSTLLLQTLPLGFDPVWPQEKVLRRARRIPGENVAQLLPLYGGFRGTETASILYLNQRGEAVTFDPFDHRTNAHMLVTGMMGAGKSFAMAHLVQQVLPLGASVVILDRLPSYQDLCAAWGGTYIQMDFNAPTCFNPFCGPLDNEHSAFLTACLAEMASGGVERLNRESINVLGDAIAYFVQTWERPRGEPTLGQFVEEVLYTGVFNTRDKMAQRLAKTLARKLGLFYGRGPYAGFFDGANALTIHPVMTVIELSRVSDAEDLQSAVLFVLMHLLRHFFAAPERLYQRKYFLSDETWALLKHPAIAEVVEDIIRTYRKLRTSAIFLSQFASDFDSPAGRVIRKGAPSLLCLQQGPGEIADMGAILQLSEAEVALFQQARRHAGWSSAYLGLPAQTGGLIHLIPDALTQWLVGQDDTTRQRREAAIRAAGGDLQQAIETFVHNEHESHGDVQ